jgi:hypothetical protein
VKRPSRVALFFAGRVGAGGLCEGTKFALPVIWPDRRHSNSQMRSCLISLGRPFGGQPSKDVFVPSFRLFFAKTRKFGLFRFIRHDGPLHLTAASGRDLKGRASSTYSVAGGNKYSRCCTAAHIHLPGNVPLRVLARLFRWGYPAHRGNRCFVQPK